ncbi:GNAT family N-acetyltransferase [Yoonia sp. BS5-3]|uniref:N-acetyltransferase family protein n=1 Tax=Yoonia phaeophyticola TaxID=3137369 RepID=A0ABZ2V712_9RHOB
MINVAPIRRATAQDGPACAGIVDAWIDNTTWMPRSITRADLETLLTEGLPTREAYVIGDPVLGYLSLDPEENHIWGFYVGQPGAGLGARLLTQAKQGRPRLQLHTHLPNKRAHAFYAREGFQQVGEPWCGEDGVVEIKMEWRA